MNSPRILSIEGVWSWPQFFSSIFHPVTSVHNWTCLGCHYVPQRYLRAFEAVEEVGTIWLFDKQKSEPRRVPIRSVAQSRAFYSDEIEQLLNTEVEVPGSAAIDTLVRGGTLNQRERLDLTFYLGTMLLRVPARRSRARLLLPDAAQRVKEQFLNSLETRRFANPLNERILSQQLEMANAVVEQVIVDPPESVLEQINLPFPSGRIQDAIYSMTWRVLETDGPTFFLTSDNPVFIFHCYGLGTPRAELSFPLSPSRCLHGSNQGRRQSISYENAKQSFVKEANRRQIVGASRFVLSNENAAWISAAVHKKHLQLSSISWT